MTSAELSVAALGLSVVTAGVGWMFVGLMEQWVRDARLRERAWGLALYAAALPPVLIALALLTPAPTVEVSASIETAAIIGSVAAVEGGWRIDRDAVALSLLALAALASASRAGALLYRATRLGAMIHRTEPASADLLATVEQAAEELGVRAPRVRMGEAVGPLLTGFRHPVLVLSTAFAARPEATETRAVCDHELAHLKRGDHRAVWGEEALLVLLACNPMLRMIRDRRGAAREEACDALALARTAPAVRRLYAQALIDGLRAHSHPSPRPALALINNRRSFAVNRLNAILNPSRPAGRRTRVFALGGGVGLAALVVAGSVAVAAQREAVVAKAATVETAPAVFPVAAPRPVVRPLAVATPLPEVEAVSRSLPELEPAAAAAAQAAAASVTNPTWSQSPAPRYPAEAATAGVAQASVSLSCTAQTDGAIVGCSVVSEDPAGLGFGAAAVEAAERARLVPRPDLVAGSAFRFTVRFRMS